MCLCFCTRKAMIRFSLFVLTILGIGVSGDYGRVSRSSRVSVINVGAIVGFNSTIGSVVKIAIEAAVNDVNSNSSVLGGRKLDVTMLDSNRNGFLALVEALQIMQHDTVAVLGPQASVNAHTISHVANELHVPVLSFSATDPTLSSPQYPFFVRATQSDLYQMSAIATIVSYYRWAEVIAIFEDDDSGRNGATTLSDELEKRKSRISYKAAVKPKITRTEAIEMLGRLALTESRVFVVHVTPDSGRIIFSAAKYLGLLDTGFAWIATDWLSTELDTHPATLDMKTLQGVLAMRHHIPDSGKKRDFMSKWNELVKNKTTGNLGLNSFGFYAYDTVWLLAHAVNAFLEGGSTFSFSPDPMLQNKSAINLSFKALNRFNEGRQLLQTVLETNFVGVSGQFRFDSDRYLIDPAYDILNIVGTGYRSVGYWSNHSGLSVDLPEKLYSKPRNASKEQLQSVIWPGETTTKPRGWVFPNNGKQLKIGVPDRESYREFVSLDKATGTMQGFCTDVFIAAVSLLPYAVPYKLTPFGDGKKNPNYSELVQLVESGFFDAAVGDVAIVTNRTKVVDFTQPYAESGLVVVAPTKKSGTGGWAFLRPFTLKMWLSTLGFFLAMGVVMWTLEHRVNDEFRGPPRDQIVTILSFSLSTLFFAHRENTVSNLGRFVLVTWLFAVLIINSSYTANLTSILTVQQITSPIKGIESILASQDPIGFQVGSFAENYLIELGISHQRLVPLGSPQAFAEALEKGPSEGGVSAVIDELPYVELFLSKNCKFAIRGKPFTRSGWGFVFPRDSLLGDDLSTAILQLAETGELQRIHDKWLTNSGCSSQNDDVISSNRLDVSSFWMLFLICGIAALVALSVFFCRMAIMFSRHSPVPTADDASEGTLGSKRLRTFFSFVDGKEDVSRHKATP